MYARGQGIAKDNEAAVYWYKRAAEQGMISLNPTWG